MLIDYEYSNWNPRMYDIGNYLNEHVCDNAHPEGCGIHYYHQNMPSDAHIEYLVECYFKNSMQFAS